MDKTDHIRFKWRILPYGVGVGRAENQKSLTDMYVLFNPADRKIVSYLLHIYWNYIPVLR